MTNDPASRQTAARRRYLEAYNSTMIRIWKDQISRLGIWDTGQLFANPADAVPPKINDDATVAELAFKVRLYGVYVNYSINAQGRQRQWFSRKLHSSVMRLSEFMADSAGRQLADVTASALGRTSGWSGV